MTLCCLGKDLLVAAYFHTFITDKSPEENRKVLFGLIHNNKDSPPLGSKGVSKQLNINKLFSTVLCK